MKCLLSGALILALAAGCRPSGSDRDIDTSRPAEFGFQKSVQTSLIDEGQVAYERYCTGCHGQEGDGNGKAALFLDPPPRNFQTANFKFSSTRSGKLPTDEDLRRTITEGLKGSAMPPFDLLSARTINALIAYVKSFSTKWTQREPASPIPRVADPYRSAADKSQAIQRGEAVYHGYATCWTCHPSYVPEDRINEHLVAFGSLRRGAFRSGLDDAVGKKNNEGLLIYPPDFLRDFVRSGSAVDDLYRVIGAGISGTAMPSWIDSIDIPGENEGDPPLVQKSDLWAMAYYVQDVIKRRPAKLAAGSFAVRERPRPIYLHGPPPAAEQEGQEGGEDDEWEEEEWDEE